MSDNEKKQKAANESKDDGQAQIQQAFDEANDKGYFGEVPDPTPREHYTVSGVTRGAPTPETDESLAEEARRARLAR